MTKIGYLKLRDLKNALHYDFINAFIMVCTAQGFTLPKITALLGQLQAEFINEHKFFKSVRSSENIAGRNAADRMRCDCYARLHRLINVWAGCGMEPYDECASALKFIIDAYKLNTKAQLEVKTGMMTKLIQELSIPENLARIETIGGKLLFNGMTAANDQVKSYRLAEGAEESEKIRAALRKTRRTIDDLYNRLCDLIEACASIADDTAPYEDFISKWNGTVKIYQDTQGRKGRKAKSEDAGEESGLPEA